MKLIFDIIPFKKISDTKYWFEKMRKSGTNIVIFNNLNPEISFEEVKSLIPKNGQGEDIHTCETELCFEIKKSTW